MERRIFGQTSRAAGNRKLSEILKKGGLVVNQTVVLLIPLLKTSPSPDALAVIEIDAQRMIYFLILIINIALLIIYRSDKRYWLITIPIWTMLISSFIIWRSYNDKQISRLDTAYWKSADDNKRKDSENWRGDNNLWKDLEKSKAVVKKFNPIFLTIIFLHTVLTFFAQIIGYKFMPAKKTYKWTAITFGILLAINL
jgi:hypothetical protein